MEQNENRELVEIEQAQKGLIVKPGASMFFNIAKFEHAQKVAKIFADSDMIPAHFQGKIGNCVIALNLAERFNADPFMVMQNIYIVHGKPGIEGKLVIALVNSTGKFTALQFKIEGKKGEATCVAYATRIKTDEPCVGPVASIAMAKAEGWYDKKGSKWKTMPGLMLRYRSAAFFARMFCPEALLGMQTKEELFDIVDVTPGPGGTYSMPDTPQTAEDLTEKLKSEVETKSERCKIHELFKNVDDLFECRKCGWVQKKQPPDPDEVREKLDVQTEIEKKNDQVKTQEEIDKSFRAEWINLKKSYPAYVTENANRFDEASLRIQKEARDKWYRLIESNTIDDKPWPFDSVAVEVEPIEENLEPEALVKAEIRNWDAYKYLHGDPGFEAFKEAYENLGVEIYENALQQLGWEAPQTSEECAEIAKRMSVIADMQKF